MEALIQITTDAQGASVVSARDLHTLLGVRSRFADWFKNRATKYGLVEDQDFVTLSKNLESGGRELDYALTLDTAKELAMVQGNEQGKAARQYFIDCENRLRAIASQTPPATTVGPATDPLLLQILHTQSQLMTGQQSQLDQLRADVEQIKAGNRPVKGRATLPGLRHPQPAPPGNGLTLRQQINQRVNTYCDRFQATQSEVYRYLYGRLQATYGLDVYRFTRIGGESWLDAVERYGYLSELHHVVLKNLVDID